MVTTAGHGGTLQNGNAEIDRSTLKFDPCSSRLSLSRDEAPAWQWTASIIVLGEVFGKTRLVAS